MAYDRSAFLAEKSQAYKAFMDHWNKREEELNDQAFRDLLEREYGMTPQDLGEEYIAIKWEWITLMYYTKANSFDHLEELACVLSEISRHKPAGV